MPAANHLYTIVAAGGLGGGSKFLNNASVPMTSGKPLLPPGKAAGCLTHAGSQGLVCGGSIGAKAGSSENCGAASTGKPCIQAYSYPVPAISKASWRKVVGTSSLHAWALSLANQCCTAAVGDVQSEQNADSVNGQLFTLPSTVLTWTSCEHSGGLFIEKQLMLCYNSAHCMRASEILCILSAESQ